MSKASFLNETNKQLCVDLTFIIIYNKFNHLKINKFTFQSSTDHENGNKRLNPAHLITKRSVLWLNISINAKYM